jgi:cephalosporin hydroxylase
MVTVSSRRDPISSAGQLIVDLGAGKVTVVGGSESSSFALGSTEAFEALTRAWVQSGWELKHSYTFTWLGRPVIQLPEDLFRAQEAIWKIRPDLIIETGVAHGGSAIFFASLCRLLGSGRVIGVDVDIRPPNRQAVRDHSLAPLITLIEGNSIDPSTVGRIRSSIRPGDRVMVFLDSCHTKEHVAAELDLYADLVSPDSYVVVADGVMEAVAASPLAGSDWSWNNPRAAVLEFLERRRDFVLDPPQWLFNESKGLTESPATYWGDGWLRRLPPGATER